MRAFIWTNNLQGNDDSPASFEKTLSTLSAKITKTTTTLENFRRRSRRYNILWVFYSTIVYLLYSIILLLVVGWRNWGLLEIGAVAVGPVLLGIGYIRVSPQGSTDDNYRIYFVRLGLINYYNFRVTKNQAQLDELNKQRDTVIERLKSATKYNTTQELLQKYGGAPSSKNKSEGGSQGRPNAAKGNTGVPQAGRTGLLPPPTANISKVAGQAPVPNAVDRSASKSSSSPRLPPSLSTASSPNSRQAAPSTQAEIAEFAPNAFSAVPQYAQSSKGSRWFDRLMDVILGEDESLPSNRMALICKQCKLVNGQAPPGTKRLEEVGKWRCAECGTTNGEETEMKKILAGLTEESKLPPTAKKSPRDKDLTRYPRKELKDRTVHIDDSEASDITQYSDFSDPEPKQSPDPETKLPSSTPKDPAAAVSQSQSPPTTTTTADVESEEEEEPVRRRRVGRPKGSKNKH